MMINLLTLILILSINLTVFAQDRSTIQIRLIGEKIIPHSKNHNETIVGGISGMDKCSDSCWVMISDDISERNSSRIYTAKFFYDSQKVDSVVFDKMYFLKTPKAKFFLSLEEAKTSHDTPKYISDGEAIRYNPNTNTLICTNEGYYDDGLIIQPSIWEMDLEGNFIRYLETPSNLLFTDSKTQKGLRNNLTFEGLSFSKDFKYLWLSAEGALIQDGEVSNHKQTSPIRISKMDYSTGKVIAQYAYLPEMTALKPDNSNENAENGVSEILALEDNKLLILERSFTKRIGNYVQLFEADFSQADNILHSEKIPPNCRVAIKKKVVDFNTLKLPRIDNIEAMSWGKRLENGKRSIIFTSDNNFRSTQITQMVVCELIEN